MTTQPTRLEVRANMQLTEKDVIETCEVHGFPLDPDQLEVVTAVVNQILLSASKPAAPKEKDLPPLPKPCQKGWIYDAAQMRAYALEAIASSPAAPAQSAEPAAWRAPNLSGSGETWAYRDADDRFEDSRGNPAGEPLYASPQPSPTAVVLDDERAAFEAWWKEHYEKTLFAYTKEIARVAWQARAASPQQKG